MTSEQRIIVETALAMILLEAGSYTYDTILVKRSLTGDSDSGPCEECDANEAEGWIDSEAIYPSGDDGPPFHPNAVLSGSSFSSYGRLQRMISAEYEGPAVTLKAGEKCTTIGPNHPMLTTRGFVRAKFLQVGDQLLYDLRAVQSPPEGRTKHSNLDQVARVEDCFTALEMAFGKAPITASGDDFHGDIVMAQHEVKAVFPTRILLKESDPCGLESLGKIPFVLPDVKATSEPTTGAFQEQLRRFLLSASGCTGGANVGIISAWHVLTIDDISIAQVRTRAFDASTDTGLYCSDGFVVSNCVCDEEYKEKRVRVYN